MDRLGQVDYKTFQCDLESLRLKDADDTNRALLADTKANQTSLDGQSDAFAIASPAKGDSCPPPATQKGLCEACRKIDFDALAEGGHAGYSLWKKGGTLWSSGPQPCYALEASARSCRLCRFFLEIFKEFKENLDPIMVSLSDDEAEDLSSWSWDFNNLAFGTGGYSRPYFRLHIRYQNPGTSECLEDRIHFCRRPGSDRPPLGFRVPTPRVPFDLIRSWLDFCRCHHGQDCSEGGTSTIQSLRVIDCEPTTRGVVPYSPKLGKYTALSYVWGAPPRTIDTPPLLEPGGLPSVLPRTIGDAITVTLNLGLRYLWVDQYCIPQDDEDETLRQIRLMDEIYRGAELTIVASAGTDANYGLPGVGAISRSPPRSIQIGVDTLVDMPEHVFSLSFGGATWSRRGWTYQEGVLSRRRLVFMENQAYFQCAEMSIWEALDIPLDLLHYEAQRGSQRRTPKKSSILQCFQSVKETRVVDYHISSYFSRELSRPEDTLQAISGIFSYFNSVERTTLMLSGLPLYVTDDSQLGPPTFPLTYAALLALGWYINGSSRLERRKMFPSWTWVGWQNAELAGWGGGFQRASHSNVVVEPLYATPVVQVGVLSNGEPTLVWKELDELPWDQSGGQLMARNIALSGWTFKATVSKKEKPETGHFREDGDLTVILPNNMLAKDSSIELHRGAPGLVDGSELLAMPLYWEFDAKLNQAEMPILLLYPTSRRIDSMEIYERVGLARCWFRNDDLTALNEEVDASRLPSWVRGAHQTVYIG